MYQLDLNGIATIDEFHKRIRAGLPVPEYYGDNLDSLYDVFSEMSGRIVVTDVNAVDDDMIPYIGKFRTMCLDACEENPLLEIMFS